jgi:hypothetical protein
MTMLVITAEIWPGGDRKRRFTVGKITASNESRLAPVSRYDVSISQEPHDAAGVRGWRQELTVLEHQRSQGVWPLVLSILQGARGKAQPNWDGSDAG